MIMESEVERYRRHPPIPEPELDDHYELAVRGELRSVRRLEELGARDQRPHGRSAVEQPPCPTVPSPWVAPWPARPLSKPF
jgi:hypothetical protein